MADFGTSSSTSRAWRGRTSPFIHDRRDGLLWARRRFFEEGERANGLLSDVVLQSWQRSLQAGQSPKDRPDLEPVSKSRVNHLLARHHALLEVARPELDRLDAMLGGTGCRAGLLTPDCTVIRVPASLPSDANVLKASARLGVVAPEVSFGICAANAAARHGRMWSVGGHEHFFESLEHLHTTAAPVFRQDGEVAGVVALVIEGRPWRFDPRPVVQMAATNIGNQLLISRPTHWLTVRLHLEPGAVGTSVEGLVGVTATGEVDWMNLPARRLLGRSRSTPNPSAEALLGLSLPQLEALARVPYPQMVCLPDGVQLWLQVQRNPRNALRVQEEDFSEVADMPAVPAGEVAANVPGEGVGTRLRLDEAERQLVDATLDRCGGNVAAAARELGVSRGWLYRRLRSVAGPGHPSTDA